MCSWMFQAVSIYSMQVLYQEEIWRICNFAPRIQSVYLPTCDCTLTHTPFCTGLSALPCPFCSNSEPVCTGVLEWLCQCPLLQVSADFDRIHWWECHCPSAHLSLHWTSLEPLCQNVSVSQYGQKSFSCLDSKTLLFHCSEEMLMMMLLVQFSILAKSFLNS